MRDPRFKIVDSDVELATPRGYRTRVLLLFAGTDERGILHYSWLAMIRNKASVLYKHTRGKHAVQCDLPDGMTLSADTVREQLRDHLVQHLPPTLQTQLGLTPNGPPPIVDD